MVNLYSLIQTFVNAHLAVYLIWLRESIAKGAKKNTSPNVIRLQYSASVFSHIGTAGNYFKVVFKIWIINLGKSASILVGVVLCYIKCVEIRTQRGPRRS